MIATENSCRRRLDLSGYWQGTLTLNPEIDVASPAMIEREFYLPLPWNRQIEDCRWPVPGRELSGIVRPVDNQNFRDIQRKYSEGIIVLRRRVWFRLESGKRVFMVFEGSNYRTEVRVNEQKLGTHDGGHLAFEFEATDALRDGENLVEITVDNFRREDAAPRAQFNWQNYGGVYRPFYLETRPRRFIRHVAIAPGRDRKGWYADLAVQLDAPAKGRLDAQVCSGALTQKVSARLDDAVWRRRIRMPSKPLLWQPGSGGMSQCELRFISEDGAEDLLCREFGFRVVSVKKGRICINGRAILILGAALHEQHPVFGNALPAWQSGRDVRLMKYGGFNTVRAAHYPHSQGFYEACDREGMLCLAEMPCWQFDEKQFESEEMLNLCHRYAAAMIEQLGHHPSIVGWIVQNESKTFKPSALPFFRALANVFKQHDPARFTLSAESVAPPEHLAAVKQVKGRPEGPPPPTHACVDILGLNNYAGWYAEKAQYLALTLDHVHRQVPRKPLLVTEMGAEGIPGERNLTMAPWTEDYQSELIQYHVREILKRPWMGGFLLWLFADYECASIGIRAINAKGLVDEYRRPKLAFNAVRHLLSRQQDENPSETRQDDDEKPNM